MKLLWITDPHLDHLDGDGLNAWLKRVEQYDGDGVLITGDIAESDSVCAFLEQLSAVSKPIWFVLGNHDAYGASIDGTQQRLKMLAKRVEGLYYLTFNEPYEYEPGAYLLGEDGWADGRAGDFLASDIMLNDYRYIDELKALTRTERFEALKHLGDQAAARLEGQLQRLRAEAVEHVTIATHVPPFAEACWYEGSNATNAWTPHFTAVAVGNVIQRAAADRPDVHFTVLCGHTHHSGRVKIRPNLTVLTGAAEYGDWRRGDSIYLPKTDFES